MSIPMREAALGEAFETVGNEWDTANEKQRSLWIVMSDAPLSLLSLTDKPWKELPEYHAGMLVTSWLSNRDYKYR